MFSVRISILMDHAFCFRLARKYSSFAHQRIKKSFSAIRSDGEKMKPGKQLFLISSQL